MVCDYGFSEGSDAADGRSRLSFARTILDRFLIGER